MASRKGPFSAAIALQITRQECVETVLRAGEARGQETTALTCVVLSCMNEELSESGWGGTVNSAGCYGNNGGRGVLKCHRSELLCVSSLDKPHEVIILTYTRRESVRLCKQAA